MNARDHLLETIRNHAAGVGPLVTPAALNAAIDAYGAEVRAEVLTEAIAAVEDPAQRRAASGRDALGWESARDVLQRLLRKATRA